MLILKLIIKIPLLSRFKSNRYILGGVTMLTLSKNLILAREKRRWISDNIDKLNCITSTKKYYASLSPLTAFISAKNLVDYIFQYIKPNQLECIDEEEERKCQWQHK